mmetsp:Transcript_11797/g.17586  ORF Transcript_11797/g.17586 Transcript_11797/m.17586 type:complete len:163 (-) Transcript_11797:212-700(-)
MLLLLFSPSTRPRVLPKHVHSNCVEERAQSTLKLQPRLLEGLQSDEEAGRTSNTMFVCIRCAERDKVTYRMLPKSENTHSQRLLKGLPLVDYKQGTAKCEECRIRNPDESNQHALWAAVEKDEEETVKARMFPKRIRTTIISRMCEREGCSSVQYTSSRGKT